MKKIFSKILFFVSSTTVFSTYAQPFSVVMAPQPTPCVTGKFSSTGTNWKSIVLTVTNQCGKEVDFQNATITFQNGISLNTNFWGTFTPLSYPITPLNITSQEDTSGKFLATLNLQFPTGKKTTLPDKSSILIKYGAKSASQVEGSFNIYLGTPVATGSIQLTNTLLKPTDVTQTYSFVHVANNGKNVADIQLPWNSSKTVSGFAAGTYSITADNLTGSNDTIYQASVTPSIVTVAENQTVNSSVTYVAVEPSGKVIIATPALPPELNGYTVKPIASVSSIPGGSSVPVILDWNSSTTVERLKSESTYSLSTPSIDFNNYNCKGTFNPASIIANEIQPPVTNLTYNCVQVIQANVAIKITGAPITLSSLKVTMTPNNGSGSIVTTVPLTNGEGLANALLTDGVVYQVTSDNVQGYSAKINPQPLTAANGAIENISFTQDQGTPISINGQLSVCGTKLCNAKGIPIQLKGMSTHGLQWYGVGSGNNCLTAASLDTLAYNWNANVIRISMYIQEGGYETNPERFTSEVNQLIQEATKRGIYALVDWHMLSPGNPNLNLERAKKFFTDIINANKDKNNLLFEIANEPNGVTWATIKTYANALIPVIRALDNKTPIIVGTPGWSSLGVSDGKTSQEIISSPLTFPNIMYTFHFYAASHKDVYLNEVDKASNTLPIFVTEFGTQTYSGDGNNDFIMGDRYMQLFANKQISWTNWNYSDDFRSGAVWVKGACKAGTWGDDKLKPAGVWVKAKIKSKTPSSIKNDSSEEQLLSGLSE